MTDWNHKCSSIQYWAFCSIYLYILGQNLLYTIIHLIKMCHIYAVGFTTHLKFKYTHVNDYDYLYSRNSYFISSKGSSLGSLWGQWRHGSIWGHPSHIAAWDHPSHKSPLRSFTHIYMKYLTIHAHYVLTMADHITQYKWKTLKKRGTVLKEIRKIDSFRESMVWQKGSLPCRF